MRHDGGNTLKSQDNHEWLRTLPLNPMECGFLQYKQHAYMAVSMLAPGLKEDFDAHATLELQHADRLATRIQQLGGVPIYNPAEIATFHRI